MKVLIAFAAAVSLFGSTGCQSNKQQDNQASGRRDDGAVPASARTPDGDRLDRPIPYGHWPYTIDRGGGGGAPR